MKLNDTHNILLAHASRRASGSLYPLPDTLTSKAAAAKAIAALTKVGFAEQRTTTTREEIAGTSDDVAFGMFVTPLGLAAIGITTEAEQQPAPPPPPLATPRVTKAATIVALLQRTDGATLIELIDATAWLPHTTRAALTGLRTKGFVIQRGKRGDATCYFIKVSA